MPTYTMRKAIKDFSWLGCITRLHEIGDAYHVVEYIEKDGKRGFSSVVDGRKTSHSFDKLELAVMHCFAYRQLGTNTQAAYFMAKMIGLAD